MARADHFNLQRPYLLDCIQHKPTVRFHDDIKIIAKRIVKITDLIIKLDATVVTNGTFLSGGLKTSLTASLGGALDQLDSTVGSNVAAAHGKLNAFIHKVQAQSSKQLPTTTANELIDSANAIIAQLQNGQ